MKTSKIIIFQPTYSISESWVAGPHPDSSRHNVGTHPGHDPFLSQGVLTHHPQLTQMGPVWTCQPVHLTCMHTFGMWAETGVPGGNESTEMRDKVQTPQTVTPSENRFFSHQCYNKMTLFMDLLYMQGKHLLKMNNN